MNSEAWLDALIDGRPLPPSDELTPPGVNKLARLQRAFADLQWGEVEPLLDPKKVMFHWDHLAALALLGSGGFGDVYRAWDPMLQREVALKLRRAGDAFAPAAGRAFIEEARRLAQVRHLNVLAVHGAAVDQGRAGIWTDLIHGETLAQQLIDSGPLPAERLVQLLAALAGALQAVHAKDIVHGDLKPSNVMCEAGTGRFVLMDFGAGARLDDSGLALLHAGSEHFMAPEQLAGSPLGTAADLYSLGATLCYAATGGAASAGLVRRPDLPLALRQCLIALSAPAPALRPDCAHVLALCQDLQTAPERQRRRRLRRALLVSVIVGAVISVIAMLFALKARSNAELERNRAVAARDFLLNMIGSPNPYQSPNPTRRLDMLFENAIAALPEAFANDPATEARLSYQFGRSLIILNRDEPGVRALRRADELLTANSAPLSYPVRIQTRSYLSDALRMQRNFAAARALTDEQATLCAGDTALPALTCIAIVNDQIEATGFAGDTAAALALIDQNLDRAKTNGLEANYDAVFIHYLQGVMLRERGLTGPALDAFEQLTERTLKAVPGNHPGLLTDLMWLAWSADDVGAVALAQQLNAYALAGRVALYGDLSRYTLEVRMQAIWLQLHANDHTAALQAARALRNELPTWASMTSFREQTDVLIATAASAGGDAVALSEAEIMALTTAEKTRRAALGASAPKTTELRLQIAAVWLKRDQPERAAALLDAVARDGAEAAGTISEPLYWRLRSALLRRQTPAAEAAAASAQARMLASLRQQRRALFDPLRSQWIGVPTDASQRTNRISQLFQKVSARRNDLGNTTH